MIHKITPGESGYCAAPRYCFPIQGGRESRKEWMKGKQVMLATLNTGDKRFVVPVSMQSRRSTRYGMMDCVTGTVYMDGGCMSSDKLAIVSIDEGDHQEALLNRPTVDYRAKQW